MTKPADMTYGHYLTLEPLLSAQHPISDHHDELLFIIIHQTKELWLKQIVHELKLALAAGPRRQIDRGAQESVARVAHPGGDDAASWDVLSTLTPTDYLTFRGVLGTSSGFQSAQFRQFEFLLGLKEGAPSQISGGRIGASMRRWPTR